VRPQAKARQGLQLSNSHRTLQEGVEASKATAFKAQVAATEAVVVEAGVVAEEASEEAEGEAEDMAVTKVVQASNATMLLHLVAALDKTARFSILQALTILGLPKVRARQLEQVSSSNISLVLGSRASSYLTHLESLSKCPSSQDTNPNLTTEEASGLASLVLSAKTWRKAAALLIILQTRTQATRARTKLSSQWVRQQLSSGRMCNPKDKVERATISVADFAHMLNASIIIFSARSKGL